jgi:hypothetical protein
MIIEKIKKEMLAGDVLLSFDRKSWISKEIKEITHSDYSHAFLYIGNGKILESNPGGVIIREIEAYLDYNRYYLSLFRVYFDEKRPYKLVKACKKHLGIHYGYSQIAWLWLLSITGTIDNPFFQRDCNGFICSELIADGIKEVGLYPFGSKIPACITPADLAQKLSKIV